MNLEEIGKLLISKGADVNAITFIYQTRIMIFLIKMIDNIWGKFNNINWTTIHFAAMTHSKEIVEQLISGGAEISAKTVDHQRRKIFFLIKIFLN